MNPRVGSAHQFPMARYQQNENAAARIVDGLAFVITPADNQLHQLNATATTLWLTAQHGCTVDEAAAALEREFEVDLETAQRDAALCLQSMAERHLLVVED